MGGFSSQNVSYVAKPWVDFPIIIFKHHSYCSIYICFIFFEIKMRINPAQVILLKQDSLFFTPLLSARVTPVLQVNSFGRTAESNRFDQEE